MRGYWWIGALGLLLSLAACGSTGSSNHGGTGGDAQVSAGGASLSGAGGGDAGSSGTRTAGGTSSAGTSGTPNGGVGAAGASNAGANGELSINQACVEFYRKACNKLYFECSGAPPLDEPCPDQVDRCPDLFVGQYAHATAADVLRCAKLWADVPCAEINRLQLPKCMLPPGDLGVGADCAFSAECATGTCSPARSDAAHPECGKCIAPPLRVGDACSAGDACPSDSACTNGKCEATIVFALPPGALCTRFGQCTAGYRCFETADGSEMRCQPVPNLGEPCGRIGLCVSGNYCKDGVCAPAAAADQPCSEAASPILGTRYVCAADASCETDPNLGRICKRRGGPGAVCSPRTQVTDPQADCAAGLHCICDDPSCAAGHCSIRRYTGQTCTAVGERCVAGTQCVDGVCRDAGPQGLHAQRCGK